MPEAPIHPEAQALNQVISALEALETEAKERVLDHVLNLYKISRAASPAPASGTAPPGEESKVPTSLAGPRVHDIRALKEQKQPQTASEMAALVAYYLSELAPEHEKKKAINSDDVQKYFKQALFKLPRRLQQTLLNAKAAGYFDSLAEGQYKLNPVGYNLVVHNLPRAENAIRGKTGSVRTREKNKSVSRPNQRPNRAKALPRHGA